MKKLLANYLYQFLFQVLTIIIPIITLPIVARSLGPDGLGQWGLTNSIVNFFTLPAAFGMHNYAIREISFVKDDKEKLSRKFWEIKSFNILFSLSVLIIYLIFSFISDNYLYLIQSFIILGVVFDISWLFQAVENFRLIATVSAVVKVVSATLIIFLIRNYGDLWLYALILSASSLVVALIHWKFAFKYVKFIRVDKKEILSHFRPALNFLILKISATIFVNINRILLGIFDSDSMASVGYFAASIQLIVMGGMIISSLNQVMLPRMTNLISNKNNSQFMASLQKAIHIQLFMTIFLMFALLSITDQLIPWFYGDEFYIIKDILPILAPVLVFQQLQQGVANLFLVPQNEMKYYNVTMICATIINVMLGFVLIPLVGIFGAVIAFLVGQIILGLSRAGVMLKKSEFKFDWLRISKWFVSGIVTLSVVHLITNQMDSSIITTLLQGMLGTTIYMVLTFLFKANPIFSLILRR